MELKEFVEAACQLILVLTLIILSVQDIRTRFIDIRFLGMTAVCSIISMFISRDMKAGILKTAAALTVLLAGLLLSRITRGAAGTGDGYVTAAVFLESGIVTGTEVAIISLGAAAVYSGILLVLGKKGRKTTIPLVPFICGAYIFVSLGELCT